MVREEIELFSIAELARLWHVDRRTIERWIKAGKLPTVTVGGRRRIRGTDVARIARGEELDGHK